MQLQKLHWRIAGIAAGLNCVGFALVVLAYANEWWLSAIVTFSIAAWLAGVVWAIYCRSGERVLALGAVVPGFLYVLLAFGPWFQTNIGPWLLTSRAFAYIETEWLGREAPQPSVYLESVTPYGYGGGSTLPSFYAGSGAWTWNTYQQMSGASYYVSTPVATRFSTFAAIGHWLAAWTCAGAGAVIADWIARRSRRANVTAGSPTATEGGESPFREAQS